MAPRAGTDDAALAELKRLLRATPPREVAALPADALRDLSTAVRQARERQADELLAALDTGLKLAPRPLRGVLRKVLVG
jgi:hypothetical protein